jgi:hypothetical protein
VPEGCLDSTRDVFPTPDGYSVAIRWIRFKGADRAFARAASTTVTETGARQRFPHTTFRLLRRGGVWRVVFVN